MQNQHNAKALSAFRSSSSLPAEFGPMPAIGFLQRATNYLARGDVDRKQALLRTMEDIRTLACVLDPDVQVYGRIKTTVSTSQKMLDKSLDAHEVLDVIGIRAITLHARDCYRLIRRIHSAFPLLPREYDDYIAKPKPNGYRSIHTTVVSHGGLPVEIQVRTQAMHKSCERGSAAHSVYKRDRVAWFPQFPSPPASQPGSFAVRHPRRTTNDPARRAPYVRTPKEVIAGLRHVRLETTTPRPRPGNMRDGRL